MPVILTNTDNTIEVDLSAALKYTVQKGAFDVILENTGQDYGMVFIVLRSNAITEKYIRLDWREISSPPVESAEALRDLLISWNTVSVIIAASALPAGAATEAEQKVLAALVETLNELNARLQVIAGMANSGAPALRVIPIASVSTAVTGPLTDAQNTAADLALLRNMEIYGGDKAIQSNINNVIID